MLHLLSSLDFGTESYWGFEK